MVMEILKKSYQNKITGIHLNPVRRRKNNITKHLKPKNSTVCDNISSKIIKYCVIEISKPLSNTINYSLQLGTYPERFKYLVIKPIYKEMEIRPK